MTERVISRAQGWCRDHSRNWWSCSFPWSGNAAVFQLPECSALSAGMCFSALHNYSATCTVPVQPTHREPGYSHKYINCTGEPFSQINTFLWTNLGAMQEKPINLSYSLILSSEVPCTALFSLLLYLISLWIFNRLSCIFCHTWLNCLTFHSCFLRESSLTQFNPYYLWGGLSTCERLSFLQPWLCLIILEWQWE